MSNPSEFPDSDELGVMGESRFAEICASAGLRATKSDRDRTGWDFIVAFKFDDEKGSGTTLDTREFPISTHIQVKTVLTKTKAIRVRLTSAEWLAKEPKPSFFYVFKVDSYKNFTAAYLLHVQGDLLEKILKRLRREEAAGNKAPNNVEISIDIAKYGKRLRPDGSELRSALRTVCGDNLADYMSKKRHELKTMGYDADAFELSAELHLEGVSDFVDAMLGLKGEIRASNLTTSTIRFGIKLPEESLTEAVITIDPSVSDQCTVTVRSRRFSEPAVFGGSIYFPAIPGLEAKDMKVRIETEAFSIIASAGKYQVTTKGGAAPRKISSWIAYWKLASVLASGDGRVEISSDTKPLTFGFDINRTALGIDETECREMLGLAEMAASLLRAVGVNQEPLVTNWLLQRVKMHIKLAYLVRNPGAEPVELVARIKDNNGDLERHDILFVGYVPFKSVTLVWYGVTTIAKESEGGEIVFKGSLKEMGRIEAQRQFPDGYIAFIEATKKETGIKMFQAMPMPRSAQGGETSLS